MKIYEVKFEQIFHDVKKGEIFKLKEKDFRLWFDKISRVAQRESKAFVRGFSFFRNGKILFTWKIRQQERRKPVWRYRLKFWIHGTYEGDDIAMETKFTYKPKKSEIEKIMWKFYKKHCVEPEEIFPNMKSDFTLTSIN